MIRGITILMVPPTCRNLIVIGKFLSDVCDPVSLSDVKESHDNETANICISLSNAQVKRSCIRGIKLVTSDANSMSFIE